MAVVHAGQAGWQIAVPAPAAAPTSAGAPAPMAVAPAAGLCCKPAGVKLTRVSRSFSTVDRRTGAPGRSPTRSGPLTATAMQLAGSRSAARPAGAQQPSRAAALRVHCSSGRPAAAQQRQARQQEREEARGTLLQRAGAALLSGVFTASLLLPGAASARYEGVNRPDLLPKEFSTVIDVAGFLTPSEEKRIAAEVAALEADTGFKLRVLAQNYPETPGLAVRDYWAVDDNTIVFVADPTFANIINVNVGQGVDLEVPTSFWSRLAGKYGNKFFWQEKGEATSILNAVSAIDSCLREPPGRAKCSKVQGEFGEEPSAGKFSKGFFGN